ncbi:MAG: ribonuclease III [Candidatus Muirbacterium halophilum]|nr:ribonuclease III [Candidatus Muirbacterium halophilum]
MKINKFIAFQNKIDIQFKNQDLVVIALTHRSCDHMSNNNERLEFLGDSVLGLVISEYLYKKFPNEAEGFLAKARAFLVREEKLKDKADEMELGKYIVIGKGEEKTGGRERTSILANAVEAIIGAVFLDKGIDIVRTFILKLYKEDLKKENIKLKEFFDYKTMLQEFVQKKYRDTPKYIIKGERGPDHNKIFEIEVMVNDKSLGFGNGHSKKEAEQVAAKQAYIKLTN